MMCPTSIGRRCRNRMTPGTRYTPRPWRSSASTTWPAFSGKTREQFDEKYEAGAAVLPRARDDEEAEDEDWLDELAGELAAAWRLTARWDRSACATAKKKVSGRSGFTRRPVELVGGRHDGEVVVPGFSLDLEQLRECFDPVVALDWNALGLNSPEGPHVAIEGCLPGPRGLPASAGLRTRRGRAGLEARHYAAGSATRVGLGVQDLS